MYVCAAKRYYFIFTGISVNLEDLQDPLAIPLTPAQLAQRNIVINLGKQLETDHSLQNLISRILQTNAFINSGAQTSGGAG
jgi:hypothetical protein